MMPVTVRSNAEETLVFPNKVQDPYMGETHGIIQLSTMYQDSK